MTYEEFIEQILAKVISDLHIKQDSIRFFPKGTTSNAKEIQEMIQQFNGEQGEDGNSPVLQTDMMMIRMTGAGNVHVFQRISPRALYADCQSNGFDHALGLIQDAIKTFEDNISQAADSVINRTRYETVRHQLILRPLNIVLHADELSTCIFSAIGDIALVLYQFIGQSNHNFTSVKIHQSDIIAWGMSDKVEQIMRDALINTMTLFPPCVYDFTKNKEAHFLKDTFTQSAISHSGRILLSTFNTTNGAISLFYPGVVTKMMHIMGGPFLAVFMNINDVMIFKRSSPEAELFANNAQNSTKLGEMLSDKVYLCDDHGIRPLHKGPPVS